MKTPQEVLENVFSLQNFRPQQKEIIDSILAGKPTLALLPTGQGKSLCFQIPGLILPGYTLVVSPLIALIQDQVLNLQKKSISAAGIHSGLDREEQQQAFRKIEHKKIQFLYIAPERLLTKQFLDFASRHPPSLVVVDEAHCFSLWGHDFRPKYRDILEFLTFFKSTPKLALFTATASQSVVQDLTESFNIAFENIFTGNFFRKNLFIEIKPFTNMTQKFFFLLWFLQKHRNEAGIMYVSTRSMAEQLAEKLWSLPFFPPLSLDFYHAGLSAKKRDQVQKKFLQNDLKIIISTNAFGMGVDKPNIRFVVHFQTPGNIENYIQEIGRAGRDQQPAHCLLLYHQHDLDIQQKMIGEKPNKQTLFRLFQHFLTKPQCHHQKITQYFGNLRELAQACGQCDICQPIDIQDRFAEFHSQYAVSAKKHQKQKIQLPAIVLQQLALFPKHSPPNLIGLGEGLRSMLQYQA